ncbi:MAG: SDR family NAD(P)-dependent oxidoreductase, partial [Solirubrobacteraceae bacterium]|nr:SDR family NAD(P)-dependent oxidoreductase [Solirubrobacteraceae bacterium]
EIVDASLDLLPRGGRFVEMGKTDIRDPEQVAAERPGVRYQPVDLITDPGPERTGEMLAEIVALFAQGALHHLPIATRDVRDAAGAFAFLQEGRHTGKVVLRVPRPLDPEGTVLITGGTGGLGAMLARHLAEQGARRLLLVSRRGPAAEGADELVAALAALGAEATVAACDVSDRAQLAALLEQAPALTAVVHTAGVLDDGVISSLDAEQLHRVLVPKVDAAIHLDELTREHDLAEFILYSSVAATLGLPGQANYAAANAVLDGLAQRRRTEGLPGSAMAFGVWETATGMSGHLAGDDGVLQGPAGLVPIPDEDGLELIDEARALGRPLLLPTLFDRPGLRAQARAGVLAPILRGLFSTPSRSASAGGTAFAAKLAAAPERDREALALDLVREHLAAVLGHSSPAQIDAQRTFKEAGIDSLSAVELRNRISRAAGQRLPATLVFDYPTPAAVATLLSGMVEGSAPKAAPVRRAAQTTTDEPIAIVGMACRYPGGIASPDDLWDVVVSGRDAIGEFPDDRGWGVERLFDPDPDHIGTTYVRRGGFLRDAAGFDADHFGISPREALATDPQQRVFLECAWEALEDAGIDPLSLRGSSTGVFAGVFDSDYGAGTDAPDLEGFRLLGGLASATPGRISYQLGLEGPAVSVDTACSSSLVAMHLAAQALRTGECDLALTGGVTVLATAESFVEMSRQRGLSPDGRCRAFGAGANGTGFSDGAGVLVMERLSVARERGHQVLAVVRGSAVNQDGASNGFAAPSGPSQERVIRAALANGGLQPSDVDAVEAHGTGTTLGDPMEAGALLATYGQDRAAGPLKLGSLKSNIGHSQAAAGVGGVIKMVQALRHELLPQTLYAEEPSPHISWDEGAVELLTEPVPWQAGERTRRAGVSSFGMSGTNAHVVIEEAPPEEAEPVAPEIPSRVLPYAISASSDVALAAQAERLAEFLADRDDLDETAVAATLALHRAQLPHRAVAVAGGLGELAARLSAFARGEFVETIAQGVARGERRAAFVFPGQGGQWEGMAVELLDSSPVFAERMRACQAALAPHVDWDLEAVLRREDGAPSIDLIEVVQPVLFAIMVSLAALWRSYGIEPSAVVGHSQGEIAAAHIIGALTLEDAARVVAVRSQALATIAGVGGMLAVALSVEQLQERAADLGDRVTIAAVNGPRSLVISGDPELLDTFAAGCEADGVRVRRILSTVPGHSPPVEAVRELMLEGLAGVAPMPSSIPLYSTVTGERIATETMDAEHWYRNLRQTVLFQPAASALIGDGIDALIEIGPHPVLAAPLQEILESTPDITSITTLRRDDGGLERFIASLADAHVAGLRVDWTALFGSAPPRAPLPTYAFQHRRYWLEAGSGTQDAEALGVLPAEHPLLRATTPLPGGGALWTGRLSLAEHAWLADHAVLGDVVVPATLFLDAVLHAAIETDTPVVDELTVTAPLVLEEGKPVALQVTVLPADAQGRHQVTVSSRPERPDDGDAELIEHAVGTLIADPGPVPAPTPWPAGGEDLDPASAYARLSEAGYELGPVFHGLSHAVRDGDALHAEAGLGDETDEAHRYDLHPALLMSGLQAMALAGDPRTPEMPFAFSGVRLHQRGAASLRVELAPGEHGWSVVASDGDGAAVISIDAVRTQPVDAGRPARRSLRNALYAIEWSAAPQTDVNGSGPRVAVLGDGPQLPGERYDDLAALVAAVEAGAEAPEQVLLAIADDAGELPEAAHVLTARVLAILQAWLEADVLGGARLVVLTRGAVAGAGGRPDLHQAPLAGLVRTAGSEHPGRFVLVDADDEPSATALLAALAADEPEVAIRDGALLVPRVRPFRADEAEAPAPEHPAGTVLITGGVTGLGAMLAHHLAARQGARHLLLVSRRGAETPGAAELVAELRAAGCDAEVAACDVADRGALERLLATIPPERPLTAVFHSAAALDDGVLTAMDGERLRRVMRPKLDAALHLHELTRDLELSEFVLFSSAACCLGNPGQANYAAANAFLDALAAIRRADGLPGLALAFGFWGRVTDLTQHLTSDDGRRVGPLDLLPMSDELGLDLIDAARGTHEPLLAPMRFDLSKLAGRAQSGILPPILSSLVRARPRRAAARTLAPAGGNGANGAGVGADAIRGEIAAALGYESADAVDMQLTFLELGFDSLVTLELRKRLQALTGLTLPTTVLFDHPTPAALVAHLVGELGGTVEPEPAAGAANGNGAHGGGVLDTLFRRACRLHRTRDAIAIAEAHARLRPRFGVSHHRRQAPAAVPLAQGPAEPIVACIPSLIASSGPHEYARFAKAFAGRREVIAVPVPGFLPNELLPSRIDAAAGAQAITIAEHAQGRPVALVGFSTGGLLAHAVAVELERIGAPVASVALIDSYTVDTMLPIADLVFDRMLEGNGAHPAVDDDRLGTMGVYLGLLAAWTPPPRAAPTLLVKATEPVPGLVRVGDWTASWPQRDAVAQLPGTHLTILEDHAETTARAVEDWVARHPAAVAPSARHRFRLRVR